MGSGASKFSFWSWLDKKRKHGKEPRNFLINELKQGNHKMLYEDCIIPKSGLAFYAPLVNDDHVYRDKRQQGFKYKTNHSADSSMSRERTFEYNDNFEQEKLRKKRMADEKRLLVQRRRERKEEEIRNKYEEKIKRMERKLDLQNRNRQPNFKIHTLYNDNEVITL